ncbi:RnfH family protein [Motiliproteus sp. SC1-56]|uniref:RnfH family protein n=1 Tax=Motiliproteus sp. SC1-56 TaxID=2799565 RepID=UPI001A8EE124|nr:RnfH family protein [Motiliproteus sp. SC1-56]
MNMTVSLVYADPEHPQWLDLELKQGSTLKEAIRHSGILHRCPTIDLKTHKTGVFGKLAHLDHRLNPGDRVEIYLPICVDPKQVKRRKPGD